MLLVCAPMRRGPRRLPGGGLAMAWLRLLAMVTAMVSVAALTVVDASPASRPLPARPVPSRAAAADTADALNTSMDGGAAYVGEHERRWRRVRRVLRGRPHDARRHDYPPLADDAADGGAALPAALPAPTVTEGLTVAFYGDSGMNVHAQRVFRMARAEADVVVHAGDFGYEFYGAPEFCEVVGGIFGEQYPYITTTGDHDLHEEGTYRDFFTQWNAGVDGLQCEGQWGVASVCRYDGLVFIGMGIMFHMHDYDRFLDIQFAKYRDWPWKVCFWHRVATEFQPGGKTDTIGNHFYERCRKAGAFIITGHEHMYGRTHSLTSFSSPHDSVVQRRTPEGLDKVLVGRGHSFVTVSGISGARARKWKPARMADPWWASVIGKQNMNAHGCLFCTFGANRKAYCEFRDIGGVIMDRFEMESLEDPTLPAQPSAGERLIAGALHPVHSLVDLTKSIIPYSRHETPALSGETGPASVDKTRKLGFMSKLKRLDFFAIPCGSAFSLLRSKFKRQTAKAFRSKPVPQLMEPDDDDDNRYSGALIATMPTATDCKPQARTSDLAQHIHNNFGSITWNVFVKDVESARVYVQECYRYGFLHLFKRCEDVPEEMSVFTVDLLSEAYRVNKVDLHRLKIRRAVIQITGSSIGVSAYERPRSRWWNPFTWSRRHRPPPAQPIEIDMYRHQRSRPPESYYSPFGAGTSAAAVRRRWWQLWRDRLARDPRTATASAALQAGTSSRYVLWTLDPTEIEQAGDRAVWVSPNIEPLIRRCFRRKDASCLLDMRAFGDGGAFLRNGFEGGVRIGARLVVEYQR